MSITAGELAAFIGADALDESGALDRALAVANALLEPWFEQGEFPDDIKDELTLEVAQSVFKRRETPSGQFATVEGTVNIPRDPLAFAMPILRRYVGYFG